MNQVRDPELDAELESAAIQRTAEVLRSNKALQAELRQWRQHSVQLSHRLESALLVRDADRDARRAALNLLEDAISARRETLVQNTELQNQIQERDRAEQALHDAERQLQEAIGRLHGLSEEFDQRVFERTQDFRTREARLRDLAAQLKRVEQKERHRLARLLHDHVQQLLVAAKMQVDLVAENLPEPQRADLTSGLAILTDAINATRDLSVQLMPPLLHDRGLPAALEWLISRITNQHGMHIHAEIDEHANPGAEEERDVLFQAAQECLLNVAKHAETKEVVVELGRAENEIWLNVSDAGAGFDVEKLGKSGSFGLFQLRQRLESIGGSITVETTPGSGTRVWAVVPAPDDFADEEPENGPGPSGTAGEPQHDTAEQISIVLVDDHQIVRDGLVQLLRRQPDMNVVGEAADGAQGLQVVFELHPQVVVMDVNMPVLDGIEATRRILAKLPDVKVIGLSLDMSGEAEAKMREAGAVRYLTKDSAAASLVQAIRESLFCRVGVGRERL